ncbi:hypothetical protein BJ742DRAFT_827108 [Cladochytrium replicatum]|nr:hypothetical protein BJ742DRAFT_827108 [Cladochytrium replicatum]
MTSKRSSSFLKNFFVAGSTGNSSAAPKKDDSASTTTTPISSPNPKTKSIAPQNRTVAFLQDEAGVSSEQNDAGSRASTTQPSSPVWNSGNKPVRLRRTPSNPPGNSEITRVAWLQVSKRKAGGSEVDVSIVENSGGSGGVLDGHTIVRKTAGSLYLLRTTWGGETSREWNLFVAVLRSLGYSTRKSNCTPELRMLIQSPTILEWLFSNDVNPTVDNDVPFVSGRPLSVISSETESETSTISSLDSSGSWAIPGTPDEGTSPKRPTVLSRESHQKAMKEVVAISEWAHFGDDGPSRGWQPSVSDVRPQSNGSDGHLLELLWAVLFVLHRSKAQMLEEQCDRLGSEAAQWKKRTEAIALGFKMANADDEEIEKLLTNRAKSSPSNTDREVELTHEVEELRARLVESESQLAQMQMDREVMLKEFRQREQLWIAESKAAGADLLERRAEVVELRAENRDMRHELGRIEPEWERFKKELEEERALRAQYEVELREEVRRRKATDERLSALLDVMCGRPEWRRIVFRLQQFAKPWESLKTTWLEWNMSRPRVRSGKNSDPLHSEDAYLMGSKMIGDVKLGRSVSLDLGERFVFTQGYGSSIWLPTTSVSTPKPKRRKHSATNERGKVPKKLSAKEAFPRKPSGTDIAPRKLSATEREASKALNQSIDFDTLLTTVKKPQKSRRASHGEGSPQVSTGEDDKTARAASPKLLSSPKQNGISSEFSSSLEVELNLDGSFSFLSPYLNDDDKKDSQRRRSSGSGDGTSSTAVNSMNSSGRGSAKSNSGSPVLDRRGSGSSIPGSPAIGNVQMAALAAAVRSRPRRASQQYVQSDSPESPTMTIQPWPQMPAHALPQSFMVPQGMNAQGSTQVVQMQGPYGYGYYPVWIPSTPQPQHLQLPSNVPGPSMPMYSPPSPTEPPRIRKSVSTQEMGPHVTPIQTYAARRPSGTPAPPSPLGPQVNRRAPPTNNNSADAQRRRWSSVISRQVNFAPSPQEAPSSPPSSFGANPRAFRSTDDLRPGQPRLPRGPLALSNRRGTDADNSVRRPRPTSMVLSSTSVPNSPRASSSVPSSPRSTHARTPVSPHSPRSMQKILREEDDSSDGSVSEDSEDDDEDEDDEDAVIGYKRRRSFSSR